jgi:hypothetical protein
LRKFDVSSVPATGCGSFHLPQGASIRLSGWRGFREGSGGLQSVPKISDFGTPVSAEMKQRRCWVFEP